MAEEVNTGRKVDEGKEGGEFRDVCEKKGNSRSFSDEQWERGIRKNRKEVEKKKAPRQ